MHTLENVLENLIQATADALAAKGHDSVEVLSYDDPALDQKETDCLANCGVVVMAAHYGFQVLSNERETLTAKNLLTLTVTESKANNTTQSSARRHALDLIKPLTTDPLGNPPAFALDADALEGAPPESKDRVIYFLNLTAITKN
jgi:uncharacterized protein YuzB (UPF0349 family)